MTIADLITYVCYGLKLMNLFIKLFIFQEIALNQWSDKFQKSVYFFGKQNIYNTKSNKNIKKKLI